MHDDRAVAFVLGTGRCGSSLVHEVLARHPDVGFLSNLEDRLPFPPAWGRWNNALYRSTPVSFSRKGRLRFAPSEGYRALDREVSPALSAPERDLLASDATPWLTDRTRRFFERRAQAQDRPLFLHKLTGWPRVGFLDQVFPQARFIHVVRDGRAVANSFLQMPWWRGYEGPERWGWGPLSAADEEAWVAAGRSFPVLAGLEWKILIDAFDAARASLGDRWLEIRYEDFVTAPDATTDAMLAFLGLDRNASFERGFARYRFDLGRADAYRRDLGSDDVAALDRILGDHLRRLGYLEGGDEGRDEGPGTVSAEGLG